MARGLAWVRAGEGGGVTLPAPRAVGRRELPPGTKYIMRRQGALWPCPPFLKAWRLFLLLLPPRSSASPAAAPTTPTRHSTHPKAS